MRLHLPLPGGYEYRVSRKGHRIVQWGLASGLVGLVLTLAVLAPPPHAAPASRSLLQTHSASRAYSPKFDDGDGYDSNDPNKYFITIFQYAIAGLVIAGLSLLIGVFYCCGRLCCPGKCGGKTSDGGDYPKSHVMALRIALAVVSIVIFSGCIQGYVGNAKVSEGISLLLDATTGTLSTFVADVNEVADDINDLENDPGVGQDMEEFRDGANSAEADAERFEADIRKYDKMRLAAVNIAFLFPLLAVCLGAASAILKKGSLAVVLAMSGFLTMFFIWINFAVHNPLARLIDDVCIEFDKVLTDSEDPSNTVIAEFIPCPDEILNEPVQIAVEGLNEVLDEIEAASAAAGNPVTISRPQGDVGTPEFADSLTAIEEDLGEIPTGGDPTLEASINDAQVYVRVLRTLSNMSNCDIITNLVNDANDAVCSKLIDGFFEIQVASMQIGICFFFLNIIAILGIKRFQPNDPNKPLKMDEF